MGAEIYKAALSLCADISEILPEIRPRRSFLIATLPLSNYKITKLARISTLLIMIDVSSTDPSSQRIVNIINRN